MKKDLLKLLDLTREDITKILDVADQMKYNQKHGLPHDCLKGKTLVTAESCTGGGIGAALTAVPGSSQVYKGGVISYTDWVKAHVLGVPEGLLQEKGAVSREVAAAMEEYGQRHGIPHGCPWPDAIRDAFETDFAAVRLGMAAASMEWSWSQWLRDRLRQAREEKKRREEKRCSTEREESTPAQS